MISVQAFLDLFGINDGDFHTQKQRTLMDMKVMDAADKFSLYVHVQGHSVNMDSRLLIYSWLDKPLCPHPRII